MKEDKFKRFNEIVSKQKIKEIENSEYQAIDGKIPGIGHIGNR
jgi:hypothetical protein